MAITLVRLPHPVTLDGQSIEEVDAGRSIAELTAHLGSVAVAMNGRRVTDPATVPPDGAVVVARAAVAGGDTNPFRTILQIALLVAAIWVPGTAWLAALGRTAQIATTAAILVGGNLVINAIAPPRLPGLDREGNRPDPIYSLTGGANRARPYEPLLLVFGTHRVFPDLGAREYTVFQSRPRTAADVDYTGTPPLSGSAGFFNLPTLGVFRPGAPGGIDQYLYQILHFGLGNLAISDYRHADTLLSDLEEITTELSGADGAITLVAGNVDTSAGAVLEDTDWVQRRSASRTTRIDLDFTGLVFAVDEDDGDIISHSVDVLIELWPVGDDANKFESTVTLRGSSSEQYRLTVPFEDLDEGVWVVRVKRAAAPSTSDLVHDDVAWAALRSYQVDDGNYSGQTRLGVRARATGQLSGRLDRLSAMVSQRIPVWDGSAWVDAQVSSNPAWLYRWYAHGIYDPSDGLLLAGVGLPPGEVDDATLKRWGAWCDDQGLTCNFVLDRDLTHADVLALIAQCGRASPSWATGKLGVVFDEANQTPGAFFGPGNIVAGSFEIDWIAGNAADEIVCRYIEPDADWQWNTVRRRVPGVTARARSATLTLWGVTSRDQAAKACNLQAARQLYHRRRMRFRVGPEGLDVARGGVVYLSHALIDGGTTGRLLGGTAARPELTNPVTIGSRQGQTDHMLFRLPNGDTHLSEVSAPPDSTGAVNTVVLTTPLPEIPGAGGRSALDVLYRHYTSDLPPVKTKVVAVEPRSTHEFAIEAIDEVAAYYDAASSDLTVGLPLLTRSIPAVVRIDVTETHLEVAGGFAVELTAVLTVEGDWRGGTVTASRDGAPTRVVGRLDAQDLEATWITAPSGTVTIRAVPGSAAAPAGRALEIEYTIDGPPGTVDGGVDGYGIEEAYALFPETVIGSDGALTIPDAQQPLNAWPYDILQTRDSVENSGPVTLDGIVWTDGPAAPTEALPVRVKALRSVPGQPEPGAARADAWGDWAWYVDAIFSGDGRYAAKELDVYLVVDAPATGGAVPATPTADGYGFERDRLLGLTANWVRTRPLNVPDGQLVYAATASAVDDGTGVDSTITFSAPVVANDVLDIDILYTKAATEPARPANTAHDVIAPGWYARPGLIPPAVTGSLYECVRYLKNVGHDIYWEHDDPYLAEGAAAPYFKQVVVEVPIRAIGDSIADAQRFDPNPATATLTVVHDGAEIDVAVNGVVSAAGVVATLTGDNADDFEIVE